MLGSTTMQHTLTDLTPGRLYYVTMVTEAGGLQNGRLIEARTGRAEKGRRKNETTEESKNVYTSLHCLLTSALCCLQHHLGKQRHQPQVVVATAPGRPGRYRCHHLQQRVVRPGNDSASRSHGSRRPPAHPRLGLSGRSDDC